ncbi:uncharacterized protein [Apostichopus japonicus]|uniref:uncharacterized protein isoform X1 n=1 Tax=Stichopus japonicus TaxID=307972 RepID=UPI003AB8B54F
MEIYIFQSKKTLKKTTVKQTLIKMKFKLFLFITVIGTFSWIREVGSYCRDVNEFAYGELGTNVTLFCVIPRSCARGIWLHINTTSWLQQGTLESYAVSNVYQVDNIDNSLHIFNISIDLTGMYACICQLPMELHDHAKAGETYVEQSCINFKIGIPCQLALYRNGVETIFRSGRRHAVEVDLDDNITAMCSDGLTMRSNCSQSAVQSFQVKNSNNNCWVNCKIPGESTQECRVKLVLKVSTIKVNPVTLYDDLIGSSISSTVSLNSSPPMASYTTTITFPGIPNALTSNRDTPKTYTARTGDRILPSSTPAMVTLKTSQTISSSATLEESPRRLDPSTSLKTDASTIITDPPHFISTESLPSRPNLTSSLTSTTFTDAKTIVSGDNDHIDYNQIIIIATLFILLFLFFCTTLTLQNLSIRKSSEHQSWLNYINETDHLADRCEMKNMRSFNVVSAQETLLQPTFSDDFDTRMNVDRKALKSFFENTDKDDDNISPPQSYTSPRCENDRAFTDHVPSESTYPLSFNIIDETTEI